MVKRNSESVTNRSAMSWTESVQWSNTHKGKSGGSSRKDDGWCRETVDKNPVWGETTNTTKKSWGLSWTQDLGVLSGIKIQWESFF